MDNSIYIMLSRQTGLFRELEVTANNIANVNTTGFKADRLLFSEHLAKDNSRKDAYSNDPLAYRDTSGGSIKMTGNPFDLAINGDAYFQVETPLGVRYTRAGNFQVDADGTVVTPMGYAVLGADGGRITIPDNARNVVINGAGQVSVDGEEVGQVGLMAFSDQQKMKRLGNTLYSSEELPLPADTASLVQGGVEASNVQAVTEMVHVMEIQRSVGSTAKFIETMYDLQRKTSAAYAKQQG